MSKSSLIKGTAVLTIAGLLTRFIGFFYRIYLSNTMGAERMGIYQLVFPIYGICFTIYASGIQTTLSRLVATELGKKHYKNLPKLLRIALIVSVSIALVLSILVYRYSDILAIKVLTEPRCAPSLRVLAFVFPFCGITSCINGYYYGLKKAGVPASTQLLEQIVRVVFVYFAATYFGKGDVGVTCELAVLGVVIGEIASNLYNIGSMYCSSSPRDLARLAKSDRLPTQRNKVITGRLFRMSFPLTANRLLISVLHSFEAILIPTMLKKYGLSNSEALSIYGILNGMAVPFILFPSAITNSLAVLLLPTVSEAQAVNNDTLIGHTTSLSIKYSLFIGIFSAGIFILFGNALGNTIFHNQMAGDFIVTLAWLCPFMYLTTTLGSILNGLGKTHLTFFNSVVGLSIRILFVLYIIPKEGITGYLTGLLVSQLAITTLDIIAVFRHIDVTVNLLDWIIKPSIIIVLSGYLILRTYNFVTTTLQSGSIILLLTSCLLLCAIYIILLFITKALTLKEMRS